MLSLLGGVFACALLVYKDLFVADLQATSSAGKRMLLWSFPGMNDGEQAAACIGNPVQATTAICRAPR